MSKADEIFGAYSQKLPTLKKFEWGSFIAQLAAGLAILSFVFNFLVPDIPQSLAYSLFLTLLVFSVLLHQYVREREKLHRYADAIYFVHLANHRVRNALAKAQRGYPVDVEKDVREILSLSAQCYSIVTGKRCRASVKELVTDNGIICLKTLCRDPHTEDRLMPDSGKSHSLEGNTDFYKLWFGEKGSYRYFLENDLPRLWKLEDYKNTSFSIHGEPRRQEIMGITFVKNWRLPYKSAIVLPIRFVEEFSPPAENSDMGTSDSWDFWGFLCLDCSSKNVFDYVYSAELGGAFADLLYLLVSELKVVIENKK